MRSDVVFSHTLENNFRLLHASLGQLGTRHERVRHHLDGIPTAWPNFGDEHSTSNSNHQVPSSRPGVFKSGTLSSSSHCPAPDPSFVRP